MPKHKSSRSSSSSARGRKTAPTRKSPVWLWAGLGGALIVALVALALLLPKPPTAVAAEISVQEAYQKYQEGAFVLDVREVSEWNEFHAPDTTLIPLGELAGRVDELPRDQEIVVVCRSGNRSQDGREILLEAGFERVSSVSGGLNAWRSAGYPTESSSP